MISTPLTSSPWITALSHSFGPGRRPLMTATGIDSDVSVGKRATGSSTWRRVPGATVTPPIVIGSLRGALAGVAYPLTRSRVLFGAA